MSRPLPSWSARDLETAISLLIDAVSALAEIENDPHIDKHIRNLASDARTNARMALEYNKEIRGAHERMLEQNGQDHAEAEVERD